MNQMNNYLGTITRTTDSCILLRGVDGGGNCVSNGGSEKVVILAEATGPDLSFTCNQPKKV